MQDRGHPSRRQPRSVGRWRCRLTFHFSSSSCLVLYCLTKSSRTFLRPSALVWRAGTTSLTVRSTSTPLIMRKHLRSPARGSKVSSTSLFLSQSEEMSGEERYGCVKQASVIG